MVAPERLPLGGLVDAGGGLGHRARLLGRGGGIKVSRGYKQAMEPIKRLLRALDDFQQRRRWLAFSVAVVKKYGEDQAGQNAALLAYYGFFSLFPLLLVAVTVLSFVLHGRADLSERVADSTLAQFPVIGDQIRDEVESSRLRGSGLALVAGLVILGGGLLRASVVSGFAAAADTVWSGPAGVAVSTVVNMLLFLVGFRV